MKKIIGILLFILFSHYSMGQTTVSVELNKNSIIAINGSTSIFKFKLMQSGEKLHRKTPNVSLTIAQDKVILGQNQFPIVLKDFTSNNKLALDGFLNLLKSDKYPIITIQLNQLELHSSSKKNQSNTINSNMNFTITGVTRAFNVPIKVTQESSLYHIDGNIDFNIHDFGLEPPIYMMGLVKVSDLINIEFHLSGKIILNGSQN